jgi:hypothetical protein
MKKDTTFREIFADDEEVCTWLAYHSRSGERTPEMYNRTRELKRDLEEEMKRDLKEAGS